MDETGEELTECSSLAVYAVELKKHIGRLELDLAIATALEAQAVGLRNVAEMQLLSLNDLLSQCEVELAVWEDPIDW